MSRRAILLLTTMLAALLMASGIALAQSQLELDQQQTLTDGGFAVVDDTTTNQLGQTFTAGNSGTLDKVSLYIGCCADASGNTGGTPPGVGLIVLVHGVDSSSGLPNSSSYYGFGEVLAGDFSTDGSLGWVDVPLTHYGVLGDNGIISAGKQYAITLEIDHGFCTDTCTGAGDTTNTVGYQWGRTTPSAYSGGKALTYSGGAWQVQDQYDFAFKTFVSPGTPAPNDTTPPNTTIDSGPSGTVNTRDATFTFSSTEPNSAFECSFDGAAFSACASPKQYTGLANGSHTFQVRAIDAASNTDPTPASRTWKVRAR